MTPVPDGHRATGWDWKSRGIEAPGDVTCECGIKFTGPANLGQAIEAYALHIAARIAMQTAVT